MGALPLSSDPIVPIVSFFYPNLMEMRMTIEEGGRRVGPTSFALHQAIVL